MFRADAPLRAVARRFIASVRSGAALQENAIAILFFVGTALATVGQLNLLDSLLGFGLSTATAAIATLYACALLFGIRSLWRRWATTYSVLGMFVVFIGVGAARIQFLGWLNELFGLDSLYSNNLQLLAGALQGVIWVSAASMYYANRDRFVIARSEVLEDQARIELNAYHQTAFAAVLAQGLSDAVAKRVSQSVSHTRDLIIDALPLEDSREALRDVAKSLRRAIDEDIRPMSHQLWDVPPAEQMRLTLPMILRMGCYSRPYPLATGFVVVMLAVAPMAFAMRAPQQALLLLAVQTLLVGITLRFYDNRVRGRGAAHGFDFWAGIITAVFVVIIPPASMQTFGWSFREARYWGVFCSLGMILLLVFLSVVHGLAGTWASVGARARISLSTGEVVRQVHAREMLDTSRRLARHLHSSLQGRLMAISLELERAADEGRSDYVQDALQRLDTLLKSPLVGALQTGVEDLEGALRDLADEWSAIAVVHMQVQLEGAARPTNGEMILGIAEEAIGNAVRHAGATTVDIAVTAEGADVLVRALNDGQSMRAGGAGLGSRWLDTISPDSWTLTTSPDGSGTLLQVRLRRALDPGVTP